MQKYFQLSIFRKKTDISEDYNYIIIPGIYYKNSFTKDSKFYFFVENKDEFKEKIKEALNISLRNDENDISEESSEELETWQKVFGHKNFYKVVREYDNILFYSREQLEHLKISASDSSCRQKKTYYGFPKEEQGIFEHKIFDKDVYDLDFDEIGEIIFKMFKDLQKHWVELGLLKLPE